MQTETQTKDTQSTEDESTERESPIERMIEKLVARLAAAVELLERAVPHTSVAASEGVGPIVAMVDGSSREAELARKLADAERAIEELRAQSSVRPTAREGRRTLPASLLAKQDGTAPEPGALDAALMSLGLEQRMAVKAQLLRSGLV